MSMKAFEDWIASVRSDSGMYVAAYEAYSTHDVDDWEGKAWNLLLGHTKPSGVLLDGPSGCGKHTALGVFLHALIESKYDILILGNRSLPHKVEDYPKLAEHINSILDEHIDDDNACCIVIDGIDKYEYSDQLLDLVGYYSCMYKQSTTYPPLFFIVISDERLTTPSMFRQLVCTFHFSTTIREQRLAFLNKNAVHLVDKVDFDLLADMVGDCTYSQLNQVVEYISSCFGPGNNSVFDEEKLASIVASQNVTTNKADNISRIANSLEAFIDKLPEVISHMGTSNAITTSNSKVTNKDEKEVSLTDDPVEYNKKKYKEFSEMSVSQLSKDLFGEDTVNQILEAAHRIKEEKDE